MSATARTGGTELRRASSLVRHASAALIALALAVVSSDGDAGENSAPAAASSALPDSAALFFLNLKTLCGQRFEGSTVFPDDPNHALAGKKLTISFERCSEGEVRIPLQAGEDKSRTWILTLRDNRLLLKHDHRHADGAPDAVTMYGGWATEGDATRQRFAADEETAKLIPDAATNVWTIEIDTARQRLTYSLERHAQPRYKAVFHLTAAEGGASR